MLAKRCYDWAEYTVLEEEQALMNRLTGRWVGFVCDGKHRLTQRKLDKMAGAQKVVVTTEVRLASPG
jgi:hypothetical protein